MVDAGALAHGCMRTVRLLHRGKDEKWLGVQLVGSVPEQLAKAAEKINTFNFDVLDFNLGCPARKVVKKGEGAALAKKIEEALSAAKALVSASKIPVTAKTRILDENDPAPTVALAKGLENAGIRAITIHGRTMSKGYSGEPFPEIISAVRKEVGIQVVANGGVVGAASYHALSGKSGCDAVMVARGAMGNPWLFSEIAAGEAYLPPSPPELAEEIMLHAADNAEFYGEAAGVVIFRKILLDYLRGRGYPGTMRNSVISVKSIAGLDLFLNDVRIGPSPRYWKWLSANPSAPRKLRLQ